MNIPFTLQQFFAVFVRYNEAIGPAPILLIALALATLYLVARGHRLGGRVALVLLSVLWLWTGIVYHWLYFSAINPAANVFAAICVLQGLLFLVLGMSRTPLEFRFGPDRNTVAGALLTAYGLVVYPLLGILFGHTYPASPTFGAPCPTTIFTFGLLLLAPRLPWWTLVIPAVWAAVGFNAALSFGVYEDFGLLAAASVAIGLRATTQRDGMQTAA